VNINENRLPIYKETMETVEDYLDIKEIDPIFSSSFEMMIKESFRADKNFILAKMSTRSNTIFT
jgi:hypothetical protein